MRALLFTILIYSFFLSLSAQVVSADNKIRDYYLLSVGATESVTPDHVMESEWPSCSEPKNINVARSGDNIYISWDGDLQEGSNQYELSIAGYGNYRSGDIILLDKNEYKFKIDEKLMHDNFGMRIRRMCTTAKGQIVYSIWVSVDFMVPCNVGVIDANTVLICNSSTGTFTGTECTNGLYQWQSTAQYNGNNTTWSNISSATQKDYTATASQLTYYRRLDCGVGLPANPGVLYLCPLNGGLINSVLNVCANSPFTIGNALLPTGCGTGTLSYQWYVTPIESGTWTLIPSQTGPSLTNYQISQDSRFKRIAYCTFNGDVVCNSASNTIITYVNDVPLTITGATSFCQGQTTALSAQSAVGVQYQWSTGASTQSITVNVSGTYTVTVTSSLGCTASSSVAVSAISCSNNCQVSFEGPQNGTICQGNEGIITATVTGCSSPTYLWSTGSTSSTITVSPPISTAYTVTITSNGLTSVHTYFLEVAPCSCQFSSVTAVPGSCTDNSYDLDYSFTISNPGPDPYVTISNGWGNTVYHQINGPGSYTGTIHDLPATGSIFLLNFNKDTYSCSSAAQYVAPSPCVAPEPGQCTIQFLNGTCDGNKLKVSGMVQVGTPQPGTVITVTDMPSGLSTSIQVISGQTSYQFQIINIVPDGQPHTLTAGGVTCGDSAPTASYIAPTGCVQASCEIQNAIPTPGQCNPADNSYTLSGQFTLNCNYNDLITVSIQGLNASVTIPSIQGTNTYSFEIPGLNADGQTHTVQYSGQLSPQVTGVYTAPQPCSFIPVPNCGDPYSLPEISNTSPLPSSGIGDVFSVAGLNFLVTEISGANGSFSGRGLLAIPFSKKKLIVSFNNISVNTDKAVFAGQVFGLNGTFNLTSSLPIDTISIGGDICIVDAAPEGTDNDGFDKVTGLNSRGFGRDSLYYPGGTKYDPNGFDFNGISSDTGTPYNEFGCNMNGLDANEQPCTPDSTLITMRDTIFSRIVPDLINSGVDDNLQKMLDSLATFDCNLIRSEMNSLISVLHYKREFITGNKDQYFETGMSSNFNSEPKPLVNNSNRKPEAIQLENKHIDLYKCDVLSAKLQSLVSTLQGIDKDKLKTYITKQLKQLDKTQLQALLDDPEALEQWVLSKILEFSQNREDIGLNEQHPKNGNFHNFDHPVKSSASYSEYFATASSSTGFSNFIPKPGEEESWLYGQGFKYIKGVSRAYYMDEAHRQNLDLYRLMGGGDSTPEGGIYQPVLLGKDSANVKYNIYLDNIRLSPTGASLDAYFVFKIPNQANKSLVMYAENINFGLGGVLQETKLKLKTAVEIRLTNSAMLRLNPATSTTDGCFVSWDCHGFRSIGLDADVELCRDFITPLNPVTLAEIPEPARFSVNIQMQLTHWSDFYFSLNASQAKAFYITGYEDYKFKVSGLTLDMSDYRSPNLATTPGPFAPHWRGFYLNELSVTFPNNFTSGSEPISAGVHNFIIDDGGVSGDIFVSNLISIDQGSLGGWPFSIDTAKISILRNNLVGGGLVGQIKVPVFKNPMRYNASILADNKYNFKISPSAKESMDMLLAEVTLEPNSLVKVQYLDGQFTAIADLTGSIQIGSNTSSISSAGGNFSLPSASFKNFRVSNQAPYFDAGQWTIQDSLSGSLAGFGIKINHILPIQPSPSVAGLSLDIGVALPCSLSATGGFEILGSLEYDNFGRQRWVHSTTKLNKLSIDATFSGGHIKGYLEKFENHNLYGSGFQGLVDLTVNSIGELNAMALFGKTSFKYFFVDASVSLNKGLKAGPIEFNGFVGGVSYKMNVEPNEGPPNLNIDLSVLPPIGQSFSGNTYSPNPDFGLGLRAGLKMQLTANKDAFNGIVAFEMLFNSENNGGGLAKIALDGKGQFMNNQPVTGPAKQDETKPPTGMSPGLLVHVRFQYDFNVSTFSGLMAAYLKVGSLSGVGPQNKMVDAHILVSPQKWYFHFGTPQSPCGVKVNNWLQIKSYLCMGSEIPGLPPIPAEVSTIAGNIRPSAAFARSGNGFLFGANFNASARINAWIGSAEMNANAGFDIMVRNFGQARCQGENSVVGFNGWYGVGQMWAITSGKLKILGVTLFDAGIAGILQAQLPNPFYGQANMGVRVKTLFGTLNKNINIKLGTECILESADNGSALGMQVISQLNPGDGGISLPSDLMPNVQFNVPLNTIMDIGDKFEVRLETVSLKSLKSGYAYPFDLKTSEDNTSLDLMMANVFFGYDSIEMKVEVKVLKNGSFVESESKTAVFTIGKPYENIPAANIESSYPADNMANYYKNEYNQYKGFIQLKSGMPQLFYNIPDGMSQKIRLTASDGTQTVFDYKYKGLDARIEFPMDPAMLENDKSYTIDLLRFPSGKYVTTIPAQGVDISDQQADMSLASFMGNPTDPSASTDNSSQTTESVLVSVQFRVSKYNTFSQKIEAMTKVPGTNKIPPYFKLTNENFDKYEVDNLIDFSLENTEWLWQQKQNIYDKLPATLENVSGNNCNQVINFESDNKFSELVEYMNFVNPAQGVAVSSTQGQISCSVGTQIVLDFLSIGDIIRNRFGANGCWHIDETGGGTSQTFNQDMLYPYELRYFTNSNNKPDSPQINARLSYTLPGGIRTSDKILTF